MPIPIKPNGQNNQAIQASPIITDVSFLASHLPVKEARVGNTSDKDAGALMKIWLQAKRSDDDTFIIDENIGLSARDISRLKINGLVSGESGKVSLTDKAKSVIAVMSLGETNKMLRGKRQRSYTEIMASIDKRGKKGYRIPKYAADSSNTLRLG